MKKNFSNLYSLFSILLTSILLFPSSIFLYAQDENYDAVYLQLKKEYTLNPDGSMDYRYVKKQKLQTYRSFHNLYGETFVVYHPDYQSLKVNEAYTIMADGKKNPSPANAFNEVLPGFAANAPAYNKLREMVITHSGTERNAVLNLDYVLHSKKGFYPCLMGNELLCETEPVKELTFVIRVPSETKLRYAILNSKAIPTVTKEGNLDVYTWNFTNVPAIAAEDFQAGGNDLYPRLIFSTAVDRNSVCTDFVKQNAFSYELNAEMKQMVAPLSSLYKDKMDLVLKLQEKVVNEFRLYPVPLRYTGFTCRTAEETWNSNGGTLLEKAVLLTALLREAGLAETTPGFIVRNSIFDNAVGSMLDVEDVFVRVKVPDMETTWLSLNSLNSQNLIVTSPDRIFVELTRPVISAGKSTNTIGRIKFDGSFAVNDKNQLTGSITFTGSGYSNPYLLLLRDKDKAKSLFGGGLSSSDLKDPANVNAGNDESSMGFAVLKEKPFRVDSDYYFLQLPVVNNGIDGLGIHLLPKIRTTPIEISSVIEENDNFSFVLPANLKPFIPQEIKKIKNAVGEFLFEVKTNGQKVSLHKYLNIYKRIIQPEEYADFKALMDHWNADRYREVVLVK
jgi:hypothetical protein